MRQPILIFGHSYGPQFIDVNNQYTHLFDKDKFHVTVVYLTGKSDLEIRNRHAADEVIFLNASGKETRGLKIGLIKKLRHLCQSKNFSIVICHRYKPTYIMMWLARELNIPRFFFVMHELGTMTSLARKLLVAALFKKNMFFAGVSNAVRDDIRKDIWRVPDEHVLTLYNTIHLTAIENKLLERHVARTQLKLPAYAFIFGNVGRLVKNKDQKTVIQAFALIKNSCPQAKLVIAGVGPLQDALLQLAKSLHVENDVIFTGFVQDIYRYMVAFDVFISASIQEAFGRVLLEAMTAKVPIIATAVHGVPEVMGPLGHLVPAHDPQKMAYEMQQAYLMSTQERAEWGMKGYLRAKNDFSQQKFNADFWNGVNQYAFL